MRQVSLDKDRYSDKERGEREDRAVIDHNSILCDVYYRYSQDYRD